MTCLTCRPNPLGYREHGPLHRTFVEKTRNQLTAHAQYLLTLLRRLSPVITDSSKGKAVPHIENEGIRCI